MMNWIDEQITSHRRYIAEWKKVQNDPPPAATVEQLNILESLKAAREALEDCFVNGIHPNSALKAQAAITNIDALGK